MPAPTPTPTPTPTEPATEPLTGPSAEELYRLAERAMRERDWAMARQRLRQVAAMEVGAAVEEVALYELAQLALRDGDRTEATRWLDQLQARGREPALREPAAFLRCEIQAQAPDPGPARACLQRFRDDHPGSTHDPAALGLLIRLQPADSCERTVTLTEEYLRRYPGGPAAEEVAQRRSRCAR